MSATVTVAERAYTIAEVAELKGVSKDFVRRAIRATSGNVLPAKRVGRHYRIGATALEEWWSRMEDA
jgi:excisionase family DNA binding protein